MSTKKSSAIRTLEKIRGSALTFGRMVESLRKCDEISQTDLAAKLKISKAHLCDIEKGRRYPSIDKAIAFAKVMGHPPEFFVAQLLEEQTAAAGLKVKIILKAA